MSEFVYFASDESQQEQVGAAIAAAVTEGAIIYLSGDLGAGKTTLVRGMLRALGHEGAVKSPTYTLIEPYSIDGKNIYHFDLYRLADAGELEYLGIRDMVGESTAVMLFEWPDRGEGELPSADLEIEIAHHEMGRNLQIISRSEGGDSILERITEKLR